MGVGSPRAHHDQVGRFGFDRHAKQGRAWITIDHSPFDICGAHSGIRHELQRRLSVDRGAIGQPGVLEKTDGVDYADPRSRCSCETGSPAQSRFRVL
jgi:hypothetical protein